MIEYLNLMKKYFKTVSFVSFKDYDIISQEGNFYIFLFSAF